MMHYPNLVSCDNETYNISKLSKDMFSKLPYKTMKGVGHVAVYNYTEGERKPVGSTIVREPDYPIIGRQEEVTLCVDELKEIKASKVNVNRHWQIYQTLNQRIVQAGNEAYDSSGMVFVWSWNCHQMTKYMFPRSHSLPSFMVESVLGRTSSCGKPEIDFTFPCWFRADGPSFTKTSVGPLCYAITSWTTSRNCIAHRLVNVLSTIYGSFCGPLQIPDGPPVVHLENVENHWFRVKKIDYRQMWCEQSITRRFSHLVQSVWVVHRAYKPGVTQLLGGATKN